MDFLKLGGYTAQRTKELNEEKKIAQEVSVVYQILKGVSIAVFGAILLSILYYIARHNHHAQALIQYIKEHLK